MFAVISDFLDKYISEERFRVSDYIHGDPVLSNILLEKKEGGHKSVKFIDMRGCLGQRLTQAGDINYDLSKLYQSLNGYDYMLLDVFDEMSSSQKTSLLKLQDMFWEVLFHLFSFFKKRKTIHCVFQNLNSPMSVHINLCACKTKTCPPPSLSQYSFPFFLGHFWRLAHISFCSHICFKTLFNMALFSQTTCSTTTTTIF